jgi:raffinose/stachyose/melibiose transport system permease protein
MTTITEKQGAELSGRYPGGTSTRPRASSASSSSTLLVHVLLIFFVVLAIGPVLLIIMNSLKSQQGIFAGPFALPTSKTFDLGGYARVFSLGNFDVYYRNSIVVTVVTTLLTVAFSTLAAFAITEYKVRLAPLIASFFIMGIMLPVRLGTVSILQMMVSWHLVNTVWALILVYIGMSLPLGVALMVTYFRSAPMELKEAARMDGANEWQTLSVIVPLVRPGLAAVASITMLPIWNDLWFPLILAPGDNSKTVTLGVQQFVGQYQNDWPALLASLVLGAVPLIILFTVFSKQFIKGLSDGYGK